MGRKELGREGGREEEGGSGIFHSSFHYFPSDKDNMVYLRKVKTLTYGHTAQNRKCVQSDHPDCGAQPLPSGRQGSGVPRYLNSAWELAVQVQLPRPPPPQLIHSETAHSVLSNINYCFYSSPASFPGSVRVLQYCWGERNCPTGEVAQRRKERPEAYW